MHVLLILGVVCGTAPLSDSAFHDTSRVALSKCFADIRHLLLTIRLHLRYRLHQELASFM